MRTLVFSSSVAFTLLGSPLAHAVPFQEGKNINCTNSNSCTLGFTGPGPGKTLTIEHIACRVMIFPAAPGLPASPSAWMVQLFDDTNALYLKTEIQDDALRNFVAGGPVVFRTGGNSIRVIAELGDDVSLDSQLACTITGQSN